MKSSSKKIVCLIALILIIILLYWFNKFYAIHKIENNLTKISSLDNYSCTIRYNNTLVNDNDFTKYTSVNKMKFIEDSTGIKMAKYSDIEGYSFNNDTKEYFKLSSVEDIDNQFEDSIFQNFKYVFNENGENEQSCIYQLKLA